MGVMGSVLTYYLAKFRRKLHENEKNWTVCGGRGARGTRAPYIRN